MKKFLQALGINSLLLSPCVSAIDFSAIAPDSYGANFLGYARPFNSSLELQEDQSQMIGAEYCLLDGDNRKNFHCTSFTHFLDSTDSVNNITLYHWRTPYSDNITIGAVSGYADKINSILIAPEIIAHYKGAGLRLLCVPASENNAGFCLINLRYSLFNF